MRHSPRWLWHLASNQEQGRFESDMALLNLFERRFTNNEKANTNTEHQVLMGGSSGVRAAVL